jgi:hypothetical protein
MLGPVRNIRFIAFSLCFVLFCFIFSFLSCSVYLSFFLFLPTYFSFRLSLRISCLFLLSLCLLVFLVFYLPVFSLLFLSISLSSVFLYFLFLSIPRRSHLCHSLLFLPSFYLPLSPSSPLSASVLPSFLPSLCLYVSVFPVGIATGYGLDYKGRSSSPGRVNNFLFSMSSRPVMGPTHPPFQWAPGVKQPGSESDHSIPSSAEFKKTWSYICTPSCALRPFIQKLSCPPPVSARHSLRQFVNTKCWPFLVNILSRLMTSSPSSLL